jgi:hypothetical protein
VPPHGGRVLQAVDPTGELTKFSAQQFRHVGVELDCVHLTGSVAQSQQNTRTANGTKDADTQLRRLILKSKIGRRCDHPIEIVECASVAVKRSDSSSTFRVHVEPELLWRDRIGATSERPGASRIAGLATTSTRPRGLDRSATTCA